MTELRLDQHQAIYFYDGFDVSSQMLIEEFESVLDGFIPLVDYLSRELHCAYAVINADLSLDSAVFFTLSFDATGRPDVHWNTPIRQLSRQAGYPMKSFPSVRICCYSSCSISWHQQKLWQPEVEHIKSLQNSVKKNTMELGKLNPHRVATREIPTLTITNPQESFELPAKTAPVRALADNDDTQLPASARLQNLLKSQKEQMRELEIKCSSLTEQLNQSQDNIEVRLKGRVETLRKKLELKWIDAVRLREVELRKSRQALNETKDKLNEKHKIDSTHNDLLDYPHIEGATLSLQHDGFSPVIIEAEKIEAYLQDPQQFVAKKLSVEPIVFAHWLSHIKFPCCTNLSRTGVGCGVSIERVGQLSDFISGQSDRCNQHKSRSKLAGWLS